MCTPAAKPDIPIAGAIAVFRQPGRDAPFDIVERKTFVEAVAA